jgi:P4 family phage/plasmid primase-like protien
VACRDAPSQFEMREAIMPPTFEKLVHDMLGGDEDKIEFLQRLCGYWLTGSTKYHLFPILWGEGGCGKSKFVNAISSVLGDYATQMMADTLFERSATTVGQYDLATFRGRRFVVAQEAESEERLKATMVKGLTGEDTLKVRLPYQEPWSLPPGAKFLMVANRRPNIDPFDSGLKRRIAIIECAPALPEKERDDDLGEKLEQEKSGILNWMFEGWAALKKSGLRVPGTIRSATDQFFYDRNELEAFLMEFTEKVPGARISKANLYKAYCSWCVLEAHEPRKEREFNRLLRTAYKLDDDRTNTTRFWKGLRLQEGIIGCLDGSEAEQFIASIERHWVC